MVWHKVLYQSSALLLCHLTKELTTSVFKYFELFWSILLTCISTNSTNNIWWNEIMAILDDCCEVPYCCWQFKLKRGCLFVAFSCVVPLIILLVLLMILASGVKDLGLGDPVSLYAVYYYFGLCVLLFIASVVLLFGVFFEDESLILVYIWHLVIHGLFITPFFIFCFVMAVMNESNVFALLMVIFSFAYLTFLYHYFLVTNSYRLKL